MIKFVSIDAIFLLFGTILSLFYGIRAYRIFTYPYKDKEYKANRLKKLDITLSAHLHNLWINSVGSAIGWVSIYLLYKDLFNQGFSSFNFSDLRPTHLIVFVIGVLGILGFLPLTFWGIANSGKVISDKLLGKV